MSAGTMMGTEVQSIGAGTAAAQIKWQERKMPVIKNPTDIIARVHKTTICGTDLHILGGNVPQAKPGLGIGHEGLVDILEVGSEVKNFKVGDRVLCCCISSCGKCKKCKEKSYGNCEDSEGSWSLGHTIDGMQQQFVRVPHADHSCYKIPDNVKPNTPEEDRYLMLVDILPTSYEIGLVDGDMADGKTVAIIGAGPVGLAAVLCAATMYKPKAVITIDLDEGRLELSKSKFGATHTVQARLDPNGPGGTDVQDARSKVLDIVGKEMDGVDVVVEAVGLPGGWYIAQEIVKPGGNIAILGVHGKPVTLNLERMWYRNFKMTAGMVHGYTINTLMEKINSGDLKAELLISHHWKLSEIEKAYELFESRKHGALKMLLTNDGPQAPDAKRARTE